MKSGPPLPARHPPLSILAGASALVLCCTFASAQDPARTEARQKLDARRVELDTAEGRARAIALDVEQIDEERRKINERLVETAALIQSSEGRLTAIEARLGELEAQEKLLQGSLSQRHDQIAKLLSALLRMGRNPPPVMVTKREDALEMVRSAMLLGAAFPELRTQAMALVGRLDELVRVMDGVRSESERLKTETARLSDARTRLAGLMDQKKQSLGQRQAELQNARKTAADISRSVADLNDLITKLDQSISRNAEMAAYEEETRRKAAAAEAQVGAPTAAVAPPAAATTAAAAATAQPLEAQPPAKETQVAVLAPGALKPSVPSVIELAPAGSAQANPGRIKPAIAFHLAKARLPIPAQGKRMLGFGDKTQYGSTSKGLVIETRFGAQVTSPCDGWIEYAGDFRSYGQLLIINAGGGYRILLAGLSQIDVQPGQFVLAAEPVGVMSGAAGARAGATGPAPALYIEFRHEGKPIDPDPWWATETRRVQEDGPRKVQG